MQSADGDLSDLRVQQELRQGGGDVFTGRHAGRLGHFTLRGGDGRINTDTQTRVCVCVRETWRCLDVCISAA